MMDASVLSPATGTAPSLYEAPTAHRVGEWLSIAGLLDAGKIEDIERYGQLNGLRFGEAAIQLGLITQVDLDRALAIQFDAVPPDFHCGSEALIVFHQPQGAAAEHFRALRNILALRWFKHEEGARTLMIVSPTEHAWRDAVPANLAIAFAQVGFRTLLIDADLRAPSQHAVFNLDDHYGLSAYLAGRPENAAFYQIGAVPNLTVMPVGGNPPNPQELLLRGKLHDLITQADRQFEVILVNAPPASVANDFMLIGAETGGALIVTVGGQTRVEEAAGLVEQCRELGIRIVGSTMLTV